MKQTQKILELVQNKSNEIDTWFKEKWENLIPTPYFSCDIRHSSHKIGVVDTNLFPGGFNNLCSAFSKTTAKELAEYLKTYHPNKTKIALLAENHTRNKFYLLNVVKLHTFLIAEGFETRITMALDAYPDQKFSIPLDENQTIEIHKPTVQDQKLHLGNDFISDLILSNNDFSGGVPEPFLSVSELIDPPVHLGWHKRSKFTHFSLLQKNLEEFSHFLKLDPWFLMPITTHVKNIDLEDTTILKKTVQDVLDQIQKKYDEYGIEETPHVFIKNDQGTYGMGILVVSSVDEIDQLNRKKKNKLLSRKASTASYDFLIQEGIPTSDFYSDHPIEPVIYGVGKNVVGGFFRIHAAKNAFESLNAPGMMFSCLCLHKLDEPHESDFINCRSKEELVLLSKFIARFAALTAAEEKRGDT